MAHPLTPQVIELASPVAESLGLEVVGITFHTNQNPPVLRVDIRNLQQDTSLDDCERMSRALDVALDTTDIIPEHYVLEVSSPGISRLLTTDREFISFKGFPVIVTALELDATEEVAEDKGHNQDLKEWQGNLVRRDETTVYLSQKGRVVKIPRSSIAKVQLEEREE
jgi:ribosome maturation factor RimP